MPVSYTHLDVYKRQIHDRLRGRLVREGRTVHYKEILDEVARQSSVCERRADEAERAVSYTHLDVYKRQVSRWFVLSVLWKHYK